MIEPHILAKAYVMKPENLAHILVDFIKNGYGTVDFLLQLATIVSLNSEKHNLKSFLAVQVF